HVAKAALMTLMYGPAVRRKRFRRSGGFAVLHRCIRPLIGAFCAPGHHGYQRACVLISGQASNGPNGSPGFACTGKTGPPSRFILSQTSAGNRLLGLRQFWLAFSVQFLCSCHRPFLRSLIAATNASAFFLAFLLRRPFFCSTAPQAFFRPDRR